MSEPSSDPSSQYPLDLVACTWSSYKISAGHSTFAWRRTDIGRGVQAVQSELRGGRRSAVRILSDGDHYNRLHLRL